MLNWLIQRWRFIARRVPDDPLELVVTRNIRAFHRYLAEQQALVSPDCGDESAWPGRCWPCARDTRFAIRRAPGVEVNWRETLECPACGMINRWRSSIHLFERICTPQADTRILLTEAVTKLHDWVAERYPRTSGSEFSPDATPGDEITIGQRRVVMQDVTRLTYEDRRFDCVLSFDVLEHVPDYPAALAEFSRVLDRRGWLLLSVPFSFAHATEVRAVRQADGSVRHLLPPDYHGDPASGKGILCYQSFGTDLLDAMRAAGFAQTALVAFASREWGYLGANVMFVGRKR